MKKKGVEPCANERDHVSERGSVRAKESVNERESWLMQQLGWGLTASCVTGT